jgi:hypothetical protein
MGIFKAIGKGIGTTFRKPRLIAILWVVNIVYAAVVAFPLFILAQTELGHSYLGSNVRPFDLMWLGEAGLKYQGSMPAVIGGLVVAGLLFLVLYVFLNGGIIGRLLDREGRATIPAFFGDCGRYFWRFVRLFLASLVFLILTFGVILRLLSALLNLWIENAWTQWPSVILGNLHFLAALLLLSVVHMVFDYARIAVVADEETKVLRALRQALNFLKKRFFRSWALYLLIVAGFVAGTVFFYAVFGLLSGPTVLFVLLGFVWMQLNVLFRIWVKALFFAAQAEFYRSHPY